MKLLILFEVVPVFFSIFVEKLIIDHAVVGHGTNKIDKCAFGVCFKGGCMAYNEKQLKK